MWTYTAYILNDFPYINNEVRFKDFSNFIFDLLWKKYHLVLWDGKKDLFLDFNYLKKLKIVDFEMEMDIDDIIVHVVNKEGLEKISQIVEDSAFVTGNNLYTEYGKRIDEAIKEYKELSIPVGVES